MIVSVCPWVTSVRVDLVCVVIEMYSGKDNCCGFSSYNNRFAHQISYVSDSFQLGVKHKSVSVNSKPKENPGKSDRTERELLLSCRIKEGKSSF